MDSLVPNTIIMSMQRFNQQSIALQEMCGNLPSITPIAQNNNSNDTFMDSGFKSAGENTVPGQFRGSVFKSAGENAVQQKNTNNTELTDYNNGNVNVRIATLQNKEDDNSSGSPNKPQNNNPTNQHGFWMTSGLATITNPNNKEEDIEQENNEFLKTNTTIGVGLVTLETLGILIYSPIKYYIASERYQIKLLDELIQANIKLETEISYLNRAMLAEKALRSCYIHQGRSWTPDLKLTALRASEAKDMCNQ